MVLSLLKTQYILAFCLELSHVALFPMLPLPYVLPCFPTLKSFSLHIVIFRHPYLTHVKVDFEKL
jgi:hypothetical protein